MENFANMPSSISNAKIKKDKNFLKSKYENNLWIYSQYELNIWSNSWPLKLAKMNKSYISSHVKPTRKIVTNIY